MYFYAVQHNFATLAQFIKHYKQTYHDEENFYTNLFPVFSRIEHRCSGFHSNSQEHFKQPNDRDF